MSAAPLQAAIDAVVARVQFGTPSAVKRARSAEWPYVAIIADHMGRPGVTHNPMGRRAYATREEATAAAGRYINVLRESLRATLADPRMRALREQHGLPRNIAAPDA